MKFPRLPAFFREDWLRKAVALLFAVLLWFYVKGQMRTVETFHDIPVKLVYDRTAVCVEADTVTVNVTLRGSQQQLQKLRGSDLAVTAEILPAEIRKGKTVCDLRITPECVDAPAGTTVVSVDPPAQQLAVDRMETKAGVPVRVRYAGRLPEGYQVSRASVIPSQVDVRAPSKLLQDIHEIATDPVPLDETLTVGFEVEKRLAPLSPRVLPSLASVHVQVDVSRQTVQSFQDLPVAVLNNPLMPWDIVEPMPLVKVTLRGLQANLDNLDKFAVRPFIDLSSVSTPGRHHCRVEVWTSGAEGVTVESVSPSVVDVNIAAQGSDFMYSPLSRESGAVPSPGGSSRTAEVQLPAGARVHP